MNRKRYLVWYIFAWVLLVVYLAFSNRLVALSIPDNQLMQKVNIEEFSSATTPVFNLDVPFVYTGGMYEYGYCEGWAFCETDYDNSNKVITVIFQNVDTGMSYACDNVVHSRQDVYDAYKNTKRIYNDMAGVYCRFSTLNMPHGTYEMLIHVAENKYDYGIVGTGKYYTKTATGFVNSDIEGNEFVESSSGESLAKEVFLSVENYLEQGKWNIESLTLEEDRMTISGWASYSPTTNEKQKVMVAITYTDGVTKYYATNVVERNDVGTYFNDASYVSCGFKTIIPVEAVNEPRTLSLIAEIDGKYYPIVLNGKILEEEQKVETTQQSNNYEKEEKKEPVQKENVVNQDDDVMIVLSQNEEAGIAYIDNANISQGVIVVKGWASYLAENNEEQLVYVGLTDSKGEITYYLAENCYREDLATAVGETYVNCGFYREIRPETLDDEYTISLVIHVDEKFYPINIRNSRFVTK